VARPRLISDDQILVSMRKNVLAHGAGVSLDVVAEELGVTAPALLKRFGSRQALFVKSLLPHRPPSWLKALDAGPDDQPLEAQLEAIFTEVAQFFGEMIPCMAALRQSDVTHKDMSQYQKHGPTIGRDAFARWLERARTAGLVELEQPVMVANAVLGALWSQLFMAHLQMKQWSLREQKPYLKELARLFGRALCPPLHAVPASRTPRGRHA
jgi:AcrR family transcriptional regulator